MVGRHAAFSASGGDDGKRGRAEKAHYDVGLVGRTVCAAGEARKTSRIGEDSFVLLVFVLLLISVRRLTVELTR